MAIFRRYKALFIGKNKEFLGIFRIFPQKYIRQKIDARARARTSKGTGYGHGPRNWVRARARARARAPP